MNRALKLKLFDGGEVKKRRRQLVVISGKFEVSGGPIPIGSGREVSQETLAEISDWQSRIAYEKAQLSRLWNSVRSELLKGATIEEGPLRAWLEQSIMVKDGKKKVVTKLRVL